MTLNVFSVIIIVALAVDYLLGSLADYLNLRALSLEIPRSLGGIYKPDEYRRSQQYTRSATRFGLVTSTFSLALVLCFWLIGGFAFVDHVVRAWALPAIPAGIVYIGILLGAYAVLTTPFGIYHTFVIEQRFGFNKTTPRLFILDRLKSLGLAIVLGVPLLAGILFLFQQAGQLAWLYAWAVVTAFSLVIQYLAPAIILPLFNKFTPMPDGELKTAIMDYARTNNFPVSKLFVVDSSRRSTRANAYFTGLGRNKRIALFDTLIQQHTTRELVGVLAHEIGHYKKRHVLEATMISVAHSGLLFFLLSLFINSSGLFAAFGVTPSVYAGLIFFALLYTPVELLLSIAMNVLSRRNENQADEFAALTTDDPASLADALKKLAANNLSNLTPHPFYVFLTYSHPPLLERVEAIISARTRPSSNSGPQGKSSQELTR